MSDPQSAMTPASRPASSASASPGGLLVVISGPSGVGKTTIVRAVRDRLEGMLSVSMTTRPRTAQDVEGSDYHFVDEAAFSATIDAGGFIEHARVFGQHWYGTPREPVDRALAEGQLVLLEIDVQGALQVRQSCPDAFLVFIDPPSEDVLLERLQKRGRDNESAIERRYAEAQREIELAHTSGAYDVFIVNDRLEHAIDEACASISRQRRA